MFRPVAFCLLITSIFILKCEPAKILAVFPMPSISHQVVFRPIINELLKNGHEIVMITTDPEFPQGQEPENLTVIDAHEESYKIWRDYFFTPDNGHSSNKVEHYIGIIRHAGLIAMRQAQMDKVEEMVFKQNNTFDLILVEAFIKPALGYSHVVKAPVVAISSFGSSFDNIYVMGAASHSILYPQVIHNRLNNLTAWEKLQNLYLEFRVMQAYYELENEENEAARKVFGSDMPALSELQKKVEIIFLNAHPVMDGNRPVPPGVIYMGGIHVKPEKELPEDLKKYLDSSTKGVIYFSLGTNVDTALLNADKVKAFITAFSKLPYNILWKWNGDDLPGKTENIRISKWLPQTDLLRHPNVKLFITQGGIQSTDEAIATGVPMIGCPMIADQWINVEKYVRLKIGVKINFDEITADLLKDAIETVIEDKSYRENIIRLRTLIYDQPMTPLQRVIWWIDHIIRHGNGSHLRANGANLTWIQYYEVELVTMVFAFVLIGTILAVVMLSFIVKFVVKRVGFVKVKTS